MDLEPVLSADSVDNHVRLFARGYARRFDRSAKEPGASEEGRWFQWGGLVLHHLYFWGMQRPGQAPPCGGRLSGMLEPHGGLEPLIERMTQEGALLQGSGWLFLRFRARDMHLNIGVSSNHDLSLFQDGWTPLVLVDLWEHAFLADYGARRSVYLRSSLSQLVDWSVAERRLQAAIEREKRNLSVVSPWRK